MAKKRKQKQKKKYLKILIAILLILGISTSLWYIFTNHSLHKQTLQDIATASFNIPYCNTKNNAQSLDFYRPKNVSDNSTTPLIVYIHGGGWRRGDKNNKLLKTYAPLFLKHGISVASLNYRLSPSAQYPDQNDDIACGLTYLDRHSSELHIDTKYILYFGDSAGGQLAAFAALNVPYKRYDYEAPIGVIDFYGVTDFSRIVNGSNPDLNARRYLGSKYNKVASDASPTTYVSKKAPQFLFLHGTKDRVVPLSQSQVLYNQLTKDGIDAEYVTVPGVGHGFIGPELQPKQYQKIQDTISSFLKETIGK